MLRKQSIQRSKRTCPPWSSCALHMATQLFWKLPIATTSMDTILSRLMDISIRLPKFKLSKRLTTWTTRTSMAGIKIFLTDTILSWLCMMKSSRNVARKMKILSIPMAREKPSWEESAPWLLMRPFLAMSFSRMKSHLDFRMFAKSNFFRIHLKEFLTKLQKYWLPWVC